MRPDIFVQTFSCVTYVIFMFITMYYCIFFYIKFGQYDKLNQFHNYLMDMDYLVIILKLYLPQP